MKKRIKLSILIAVSAISVALLDNSCTWKKEKDLVKPAVDTSHAAVTYTKDIAPIFSQYCITCHKPGGVEAQVDYTTYDNVKLYTQSGNVMDRITRDPNDPLLMPQGGPKLPQVTIDKIQAWINDGYLK
jgi:mono/diheme cytochrome c family protein